MNLKKHLPEILTGIAVGSEVLASAFYIHNSKKLYENNPNPTTKEYLKFYILPGSLSAASIVAMLFSNRMQAKENAKLLALNAAIIASSLQNREYSKELETHVDPKELEEIQASLTQRDLDAMIDDAVEEDQLNSKRISDRNIYFFPQVRKMIFGKEEDLCRGIQYLNDELSTNDFASFADFFDYITDYNDEYHFSDLEELGWLDCYGLELSTYVREVRGFPVTYVNISIDPLYREEWSMYYDYLNKVQEEDTYEKEIPFKMDERR